MTTVITREQGYAGFSPEIVRIVTTATLAQVTTAGWYNNSPIAGESLANVDVVLICYAYGTTSQATEFFSVAISAKGVVTLSVAESSVILPVVSGDIPKFSGTTGTIQDSGILATNLVVKNAVNTMAAGSSIVMAKVNGTEASNAVTASGVAGLLTTSSLTTAGGSSYAITWTNTFITATSVVLLTIAGGTNTTENITLKCVPGAGSSTLTIYNNTASTALNGTILISYLVI